MVRQDVKGKIAFMSSVLGYMSIIGYSTYSPGKHALRGTALIFTPHVPCANVYPGLAETLRSELQLYDISVHIQFPGTIQGASLEEEKKVKPKITLKIEETDVGAPSEAIAKSFLDGVKKGDFHITVDFITDVFRSTTRGSSPFGSILDLGYEFIGTVSYIPPPYKSTETSLPCSDCIALLEEIRR
jgi:3-dehydrosphinganine reductase